MSGMDAAEAIVLLAIFLGGVVLGLLVVVSLAIKREDRGFTLTQQAPDAAARGARLLTGVGSRDISPPAR
jgi:hypothetical protein